jgi:hypothetical protein
MPIDPVAAADALLNAGAHSYDELTFRADVVRWSPAEVKAFLDRVISASPGHNLRLKGIRMLPTWFTAVGAQGDSSHGGKYAGVPVAVSGVDFDTIELVFRP